MVSGSLCALRLSGRAECSSPLSRFLRTCGVTSRSPPPPRRDLQSAAKK
jgi:hypothetical protein